MILESNFKQRNHTELNSAENTNLLPAAKGLLVYRSKTNLILDLCKLVITLNSSFEYLNKVKKKLYFHLLSFTAALLSHLDCLHVDVI